MQARLRELLAPALNAKPFWMRAELSSVSLSKGRLYCDLVEMKDGEVVAKMRCTIWNRDLVLIQERLREARLDDLLSDGNEVGLSCRIQYHALYGMSVQALDIDPSEALGELERKRQVILAKLGQDGLLGKNAELAVPSLPRRVGLIASLDTAGYHDFCTTILRSGYGVEILAADARVEGDATELSVLRALECLAQLDVDLVVLLRGGGSRLSLSYLDSEAIARAIADHPHPVWTAIGHETDRSVLDEVAARSFKTPTAAAEELVGRFVETEHWLAKAAQSLRTASQLRLRPERSRLDEAWPRLQSSAQRAVRERRQWHKSTAKEFYVLVDRRLSSERARIVGARTLLRSSGRSRVLVAFRALAEHRKSLHKTIGRSTDRRRERLWVLRERLLAPSRLQRIEAERRRYRAFSQILRAADPVRNLERGYALVTDAQGALVRSVSKVEAGAQIRTALVDGSLLSTVVSKEKR